MIRILLTLLLCVTCFAEDKVIPDSANQAIRFSAQGVSPRALTISLTSGLLFIYNDSERDLAVIRIDYGGHETHCASSNLEIRGGKAVSKSPLGPKDFATVCFPAKGTYPFEIISSANKIYRGLIRVI